MFAKNGMALPKAQLKFLLTLPPFAPALPPSNKWHVPYQLSSLSQFTTGYSLCHFLNKAKV